mmetsp:Transcript_54859/g.174328  ORF Transcript_54859/g.174328 Transcript_54859/m.174328 type:complete len:148 (-) Transcript_54859:808-1251(-)
MANHHLLIAHPPHPIPGCAAGAFPFVIASYEFGKRIWLQRQCEVCRGSGLVQKGRFLRKCPACGGFLPWQSWGKFFESNKQIGNGGPLMQPAKNYDVMQEAAKAGELPYGAPEPVETPSYDEIDTLDYQRADDIDRKPRNDDDVGEM